MKEILRLIFFSEDQSTFDREVACIVDWHNEARPYMTLNGKTPNEVDFSRERANEQPRIEPRRNWQRGTPCAKPQVDIDRAPGDAVIFEIDCLEGRRHLPIIRVRCAA
jgi:hypothetical protein